jgi:hypothetical protein
LFDSTGDSNADRWRKMELIWVRDQFIFLFQNFIGKEKEGAKCTILSKSHLIKKAIRSKLPRSRAAGH